MQVEPEVNPACLPPARHHEAAWRLGPPPPESLAASRPDPGPGLASTAAPDVTATPHVTCAPESTFVAEGPALPPGHPQAPLQPCPLPQEAFLVIFPQEFLGPGL